MKYEIIEDCSPYYIRFTHIGIDNIIDYINNYTNGIKTTSEFTHRKLPKYESLHVLSLTPISTQIPLVENRVSLFISKPGLYYRAHKDGLNNRFSINYVTKVLDNNCVTNWYSDEDLKDYPIDNTVNNLSRECLGFVKENHIPLKSMIAKQNECILFNTEIFHDWDNTTSQNERIVLTLRIIEELKPQTYFEDVRKILFNY
jgi:hypothetical protein